MDAAAGAQKRGKALADSVLLAAIQAGKPLSEVQAAASRTGSTSTSTPKAEMDPVASEARLAREPVVANPLELRDTQRAADRASGEQAAKAAKSSGATARESLRSAGGGGRTPRAPLGKQSQVTRARAAEETRAAAAETAAPSRSPYAAARRRNDQPQQQQKQPEQAGTKQSKMDDKFSHSAGSSSEVAGVPARAAARQPAQRSAQSAHSSGRSSGDEIMNYGDGRGHGEYNDTATDNRRGHGAADLAARHTEIAEDEQRYI